MRYSTAITIVVVLVLSGCQSRPATFSKEDESLVRAVADSAVSYQMAGNWTAWADLFSEDGVLQPPNGPAVKGRAALIAWAKKLPPIEKAGFTDVQVWGEGNLSYGMSGYTFTMKGLPPDTGKQLWVSRRAPSGKWEVMVVSFNSDLPLPGQQGRDR